MSRQCGILLHPTSLASKGGIGDLGIEAYRFVDFLVNSAQSFWQVLPLNPVGFAESPYQGLSAFAGNPLLISLDELQKNDLLSTDNLVETPCSTPGKVDFSAVKAYKTPLLRRAYENFKKKPRPKQYKAFCLDNSYWLNDFALYMSLKEHYKQQSWNDWDWDIASRNSKAIAHYQKLFAEEINYHIFLQYVFAEQWHALKTYANSYGIKIIGDLPIYVAYDSSDTWSHPRLFDLDERGCPRVVAGVPPDYFSPTGQLWGNPIYNWEEMKREHYYWWVQRIKYLLKFTDIIRIDHFRGFEAYWQVPLGDDTAINGKWVQGPGAELFTNIAKQLGDLPIIAEDLGLITPAVEKLKQQLGFPGMKVLQFTLESNKLTDFSPYHYQYNTVIYTGTHDNDTTVGWLKDKLASDQQVMFNLKKHFHLDISQSPRSICWRLIEIAYQSPVSTVIIPMQDILGLGTDARMNTPATVGGNNWCWRLKPTDLTPELEDTLKENVTFYNRVNVAVPIRKTLKVN